MKMIFTRVTTTTKTTTIADGKTVETVETTTTTDGDPEAVKEVEAAIAEHRKSIDDMRRWFRESFDKMFKEWP